MARGFMIFMRGLDITCGIGRVLFCDFRAQNRRDFQQNPFNAPSNVKAPHKNHKAQRHIINSVIGNFIQMRTQWMFQGPNTSRLWYGVGRRGGTQSADFGGRKVKVYLTPL